MDERKILLCVLFLVFYCMYSVNMWFTKTDTSQTTTTDANLEETEVIVEKPIEIAKPKVTRAIPLFIEGGCSILEVFTQKPKYISSKKQRKVLDDNNNAVTVIGITVFLIILVLNAILDVLKVKEEERAKRKLNPSGERRQSLAEFANKKSLRRESSKFGQQLFQIAESFMNGDKEEKPQTTRLNRPYTRGESTNSYLSDRKVYKDISAPASIGDTPTTDPPKLVKRQSVAKLFGARPVPMVRRSSFPVLPLNPEVQALMLGNKQMSFDSDDESDGRGRRVRFIRRY